MGGAFGHGCIDFGDKTLEIQAFAGLRNIAKFNIIFRQIENLVSRSSPRQLINVVLTMNGSTRVATGFVCGVFFLLAMGGCESTVRSNTDGVRGDTEADAWSVEDRDTTGAEDVRGSEDALTDAILADATLAADAEQSDTSGFQDAGPGQPDATETDAGSVQPDTTADPVPPAAYRAAMTYVTANIGRNYSGRSTVAAVFDRLGDNIGPRSGPKFLGWQEIGEGDPCGGLCEINALRNRFKTNWGWSTYHLRGQRPDGNRERAKVPVTSKGVNPNGPGRAVFASPGWAHVSPTRFVTVVRYAPRNLSVINTHFIAGAWSCKPNRSRRRSYWWKAWRVLKQQVAQEHERGHNVVVTGDLNRPRQQNNCNPSWNPTSLHGRAKVIGGSGIDYVFAVPAAGYKFVVATRPNGTKKRGSIHLGIDGHQAHWVRGRFQLR